MSNVAPLAGAWIEIFLGSGLPSEGIVSLPSRERGLKFWLLKMGCITTSRSPRGSVD